MGEEYTFVSSSQDKKKLISPGRLSVFSWNYGNINKIFIKNIFSAVSLKYKVSAHDQIAFSQYQS